MACIELPTTKDYLKGKTMSDQQDRKLQHTDDQMPGVGAEIWKPGEPASAAETGEPGQPAQESSVGIRETRSREEKAGVSVRAGDSIGIEPSSRQTSKRVIA
jgi:hypothetical protein